ncbi:hypothetical protein JOB18_012405 [Solea senegalensis]|uniref:Uncharacterized protein n=1 Tax=Solea senegalensis TaxID=28829 RepID=A0AAV6PRR4_SOLSE|nr:hypothetical protein JOB18_012405 [Solea senegalensis]
MIQQKIIIIIIITRELFCEEKRKERRYVKHLLFCCYNSCGHFCQSVSDNESAIWFPGWMMG